MQHKNCESQSNSLFLRIPRTDVLSILCLHSNRMSTPWGKPSSLWTFRPKVPSWIWIRCIYYATYRNTFMLHLTFAMSSATRNFAQTFGYFIPPNSVGDHHSSLSHCYRTTLMADCIIPVLIQLQNLCYECSDANLAQTPSCLIPSLFCLSISKTFIPHYKINGT